MGFPGASWAYVVARVSRPLWRERPAPACRKLSLPLKRGPSQPLTRRKRARAEPALSGAKGCPRHSGRDARATTFPPESRGKAKATMRLDWTQTSLVAGRIVPSSRHLSDFLLQAREPSQNCVNLADGSVAARDRGNKQVLSGRSAYQGDPKGPWTLHVTY